MGQRRSADEGHTWKAIQNLTWQQVRNTIRRFWPPTPLQALFFVGFLLLLALGGYALDWTGFGESVRQLEADQDLQRARTLWDWLSLLIVPVVVGLGVALLSARFTEVGSLRASANAERHARENALHNYFDQVGSLVADKGPEDLLLRENEFTRKYLQERTSTVLRNFGPRRDLETLNSLGFASADLKYQAGVGKVFGLSREEVTRLFGPDRRKDVLKFLHRMSMIRRTRPIVELGGEDLARADLVRVELADANLGDADLTEANLLVANLSRTDLRGANLTGATLTLAKLNETDLTEANMTGADLEGADLTDATVAQTQLLECKSLRDAVMPDGTKHG